MSHLSCRNIHKKFGQQTVLEGIDFSLDKGECLVLLGPSGCGKTTLLNILSGAIAADGGELHLDGEALDIPARGIHVPMRQRGFSMVFQDFSLWPHMSVEDNVSYGLRIRGIKRQERIKRVQRVLEQVQMTEFKDRHPATLSGGQQQRVSIARALAVQPRLILLDEPLSALDARLREDLKSEIARLLKDNGLTAVYVTHDQSEAFALGDQVALMYQGRIEQMGSPQEIYRQPRSRFVAGFIGSSNLFEYRRNGTSLILGDEIHVPMPLETLPETGHMVLRRESVRVVPDSSQNAANDEICLPAVCHHSQFLGDRHEVLARLVDDTLVRGFADDLINPGHPVEIRFSMHAMHFVER
ncbi:ABC transporter ATP-binding protein [Thioalkalivibrio sulfidiphilus]|uniref:ABC transporter ATP-binding protein n=1 Tax=Thioalkalivibrio sulfidiphilus TaxID=1033854 RepID=UPI0003A2F6ED|nr:ABC transporter ATP-binding protein [Thioalkalivibrio sulfidiphilus]